MRDLIAALSSRAQPVLVQHSPTGERLELTGMVLANWVYKATGLLADCEVGPDLRLVVLTPTGSALHWRALATVLGAWALSAPVQLLESADDAPADPFVLLRDEADSGAGELETAADEVIVFAAAALALSAQTPPDCIDLNAGIRAHPDIAALPQLDAAGFVDVQGDEHMIPLAADAADSTTGTAGGAVALHGAPQAADWRTLLQALLHGVLIIDPDPALDTVDGWSITARLGGAAR